MINPLFSAGQRLYGTAARWLAQHPKQITVALTSVLLGGGGAAFAIASLTPDVSELAVQQVLETVQPQLNADTQALLTVPLQLYRSDITRSNDTADTLLQRLGVDDPQAAAFLRTDTLTRKLLLGQAGRHVSAETVQGQGLRQLIARWSPDDDGSFKRLVIERGASGFSARLETAALRARSQLASGTIQSSLFAATDAANLPDSVASQLTEIFSGDIDFHRSLRKGDRFSVVYETLEGDGEVLRIGKVLSAEFVNHGKTYQAMWFQGGITGNGDAVANPQKGGYYTLDGQSLSRAFLASPMEFSRVTSGFQMRIHPILKTMRAHQGIDYGAPTGTPVRSIGRGVVEFAGVQNGYGNVVHIRHDNQHVTTYAHLSRIHVRKGQSVAQGQHVGAVGATGWATGPHLHFEFRVNGQQQDPQILARQRASLPIAAAVKPQFERSAQQMRVALAAAVSQQTTRMQ